MYMSDFRMHQKWQRVITNSTVQIHYNITLGRNGTDGASRHRGKTTCRASSDVVKSGSESGHSHTFYNDIKVVVMMLDQTNMRLRRESSRGGKVSIFFLLLIWIYHKVKGLQ